jgi:integrase
MRLTRADVMTSEHEIRAAGTKAYSRDRMCRVADWAWPALEAHSKHMLPTARLFPADWTRWTVSDWHRQTLKRLGLAQVYPLHCARDHWAVRALRASAPVAVVQQQLGHSSPMLTLTKYGRFIPTAADRNEWERRATEHDTRIRAAK